MSVILIIVTPSDGDVVTSYDIGPHTGSPLEGVHDTTTEVVKHEVSVAVIDVIGEGGPVRIICHSKYACAFMQHT